MYLLKTRSDRSNLLDSTNRGIIKLHATGTTFINGIASSYSEDYPVELTGIIQEETFLAAINQINNTLADFWPCLICYGCGYTFCLCTFGLSLLCPNLCISDAEKNTQSLIERINKRDCFKEASVEWELKRRCGHSWIQLSYPLSKDKTKTLITKVLETT